MCVSFWPTNFSTTITGTWEVLVDGVIRHVLWYQNNVGKGTAGPGGITNQVFEVVVRQAIAGENWKVICQGPMQVHGIESFTVEEEIANRKAGGSPRSLSAILESYRIIELKEEDGNCLIIPLLGSWNSIRLLNTTEVPKILDDISNALEFPAVRDGSLSATAFGGGGSGIVFIQFGIYDIVIAENAASLPAALAQINPLKRPKVNDEVFGTLEQWYKCPVAVCCFNNAETGTAKPLAFAFEPLYPDKIVVYTLDAHDGKPPNPSALVNVDHTIFVGSYLTPESMCATVDYSNPIPEHLQPFILRHVMGTYIKEDKLENGDIIFNTEDVRRGRLEGLRSLPPFGPHGAARLGHRVTRDAGYTLPRKGW